MTRKQLLIISCLAIIFVKGDITNDLDSKVINGRKALPNEFPFIVSLQWQEGGDPSDVGRWCGGSIIRSNWVLTAAHCVEGADDLNNFYVRAGVTNSWDTTNPNGQFIKVKKAFKHPDYLEIRNTNPDDIALLLLEKELIFNKYVQPIPLPTTEYNPKGMSTIIGWGEAGNITHHYNPDDLQAVTTPIYPLEECRKIFGTVRRAHNKHICPGDYGSGACQGDSGGPLVQIIEGKQTLIGVCSFTSKPCATAPSVYVDVSSYIYDFINPTIRRNML